jgi:uncharacterized membrane protein
MNESRLAVSIEILCLLAFTSDEMRRFSWCIKKYNVNGLAGVIGLIGLPSAP